MNHSPCVAHKTGCAATVNQSRMGPAKQRTNGLPGATQDSTTPHLIGPPTRRSTTALALGVAGLESEIRLCLSRRPEVHATRGSHALKMVHFGFWGVLEIGAHGAIAQPKWSLPRRMAVERGERRLQPRRHRLYDSGPRGEKARFGRTRMDRLSEEPARRCVDSVRGNGRCMARMDSRTSKWRS